MNVKERLREIMKILNMKQYQFGESINISGPTISDWLKKPNVNPSLESLIRISEVHNINLNWLLLGEGSMFKEENSRGNIEEIIKIPIFRINREDILKDNNDFINIDRALLKESGPYEGYHIDSSRWKPWIEKGDVLIITKEKSLAKWEGEIGIIKKDKRVDLKRIFEAEDKKWLMELGGGKPEVYNDGNILGRVILLIRQIKETKDEEYN